MKLSSILASAAAIATLSTTLAHADVVLDDPWVRSTVPQQKATGFFAKLKASTDTKLVGASSPVANVVEVHEMAMDGNVMKMRQVPAVELPAGQAVELSPGGYHVMLMDLKQQIKAGETVPVTLVFQGKDGKRETVDVSAPVRALGAAAGTTAQPKHKH